MTNTTVVPENKIAIARKLNTKYHVFCTDRTEHQKRWQEIKEACEDEGISTDLIQISPDVFTFLVNKNAVDQYFKVEQS